MAELTCPSLGTGSVDLNALSDAAKKAKTAEDLAAAVEKSTVRVEAPAAAAEPVQAAPADAGSAA